MPGHFCHWATGYDTPLRYDATPLWLILAPYITPLCICTRSCTAQALSPLFLPRPWLPRSRHASFDCRSGTLRRWLIHFRRMRQKVGECRPPPYITPQRRHCRHWLRHINMTCWHWLPHIITPLAPAATLRCQPYAWLVTAIGLYWYR